MSAYDWTIDSSKYGEGQKYISWEQYTQKSWGRTLMHFISLDRWVFLCMHESVRNWRRSMP